MKVLYLAQFFDPEPVFKGLRYAKALKEKGHDIEVITGFPNYPEGKIYDGYKLSLYRKEIIEGITVHRVWLYPNHGKSVLKRLLNYISFFISSLILGLLIIRKFDIIHAMHTPLNIGLSAALFNLWGRKKLIFDIQDIWPDSLPATNMVKNKKILRLVDCLCNWTYKQADSITVISPGFKALLIQRGVSQDKIRVIYNWSGIEGYPRIESSDYHLEEKNNNLNVLFAGNMGRAQNLTNLINAAKILEDELIGDIKFHLIGGGVEVEELKEKVKILQLKNVIFYPRVPMDKIINYIDEADVVLVHLKKDPLFEITIPSKTQAYLSLGKPILINVTGDAAKLIVDNKAGYYFEPDNPQKFKDLLIKMRNLDKKELTLMGENAKKLYDNELSKKVGVSKFCRLYESFSKKDMNNG